VNIGRCGGDSAKMSHAAKYKAREVSPLRPADKARAENFNRAACCPQRCVRNWRIRCRPTPAPVAERSLGLKAERLKSSILLFYFDAKVANRG